MAKIDELRAQMAEAVAEFQKTGDMSKIQEVTKAMDKAKAELAKAEAEKLRKEAEALAGRRETLAAKAHSATKALGLDADLIAVKAWGFTYKVDKANPSEPDITYKSVSLLTQAVKTGRKGTGGGAGKSKDEYGISLAEIVEKFGTAEEQAAIANAPSNSRSWQLKVVVKKRAIAEGKLAPVK